MTWSNGRRFAEGDTVRFSGVAFRVVKGKKGVTDLRLDWYTGEGWQPVTADAIFYMVDMLAENEDLLYPPPAQGGAKLMTAIRKARNQGWRAAAVELHEERAAAEERRAHRQRQFDGVA